MSCHRAFPVPRVSGLLPNHDGHGEGGPGKPKSPCSSSRRKVSSRATTWENSAHGRSKGSSHIQQNRSLASVRTLCRGNRSTGAPLSSAEAPKTFSVADLCVIRMKHWHGKHAPCLLPCPLPQPPPSPAASFLHIHQWVKRHFQNLAVSRHKNKTTTLIFLAEPSTKKVTQKTFI